MARGKHGPGGAPAEEAGPELGVASRPKVEPGAWLDPGAWLAPEVVAPSSGLRLPPGVRGTPFRWGQWEGNRIHRPGLLHVSVFPVFAEADVAFFIRGCGAQVGSEASGPRCGGLVGEPGAGGAVLLRRTAAVGAEADAAQDGQQGGAPAQVERRAQLILGSRIRGVEEVPGDVGGVPGDGHHPAATSQYV